MNPIFPAAQREAEPAALPQRPEDLSSLPVFSVEHMKFCFNVNPVWPSGKYCVFSRQDDIIFRIAAVYSQAFQTPDIDVQYYCYLPVCKQFALIQKKNGRWIVEEAGWNSLDEIAKIGGYQRISTNKINRIVNRFLEIGATHFVGDNEYRQHDRVLSTKPPGSYFIQTDPSKSDGFFLIKYKLTNDHILVSSLAVDQEGTLNGAICNTDTPGLNARTTGWKCIDLFNLPAVFQQFYHPTKEEHLLNSIQESAPENEEIDWSLANLALPLRKPAPAAPSGFCCCCRSPAIR